MVIDCDADIRSSTSPSSKKFKSSTNRAIAWTSSSLTRSHDFPSQVAPSLYLATQTAISVWIKRRFGDFLVCNGNIFYCLFSSFPSHLRSPLLLLLLWWRLCRLLLLLLLLQRQLKNILMAKVIILGTFWTKYVKQSCLRCRSLLLLLLLLLLSRDLLLLRSRWSRSSRCSPEKYINKIFVKKYLKYSKSKISMLPSFSPPLLHIFSTTSTLRGRRRLQHLCLALGGPELKRCLYEEHLRPEWKTWIFGDIWGLTFKKDLLRVTIIECTLTS